MGEKLKKVKLLKFILVLGLAILSLAILMIFLGTNAQADIIVPVDQPTIQDAIDAAIPGENIYVWNGTYNENITIDKSVHLIGNGSATTFLDASGLNNNAVNITAEGVEITGLNITNTGTSYGIWSSVGGFNIHDNIFNTQNWAIYMDINRLNPGSTTVGDIIVDNNEVIGTHGFHFNIWIEEPLSDSDFIFGKTEITNNTLYNTQKGIEMDRYTVFSMNQGSVTWGDILVKDNFVSSQSDGIFFWGIFWNITDVNIDLGKMEFSDNNVTAQSHGIYIDWWDFADGIYGNTIATTQDTYVNNNDIVCQSGSGIYLQTDIIGNIIYDSTSVTTGDFFIYSNNITTTSTSPGDGGIRFKMSEIAREMYNDSSVNFGNIYIDSNIVDSNTHGIYLRYMNSCGTDAYDNALVKMGDVQVTNNEIFSVDHGIYLSLNNLGYVMYDYANATLGNFIINNNNLSCSGNGIYIDMDQLGNDMHDRASLTMGHFTIDSNNITSVNQGINIQGKNIARNMHNDTIFSMWDFTINSNTINSTNSMGIVFGISSSAYTMTGNATATFGSFLFTNNNITALTSHGLWCTWDYIGIDMHDGAVVTTKDFHLDDNTFECGILSYVIDWEFDNVGNNMHGDSFFSLGDRYAEGNIILSGFWGIYAGREFWGNDMYDNSIYMYGDFFIRNNVINVTGGAGIIIDYIDTGENMAGTSSVTGGNMSIVNNIVASRDSEGIYIDYGYIGYNISDFSYVSTGWIDISYNNFSSVNNHGAYIWMDYNGAYMYGNSQVYIGDIMFTHNNVWSDTMDALNFNQFYRNAYMMFNDSYAQIGNLLVNDNYLNANDTGDGIVLFQWQENAYEMSHNASADFGNFEFNHNTITAGDGGIIMSNMGYWGNYLRGDNQVTFGHFFLNDNIINNSNGYGIRFSDWYDVGKEIYGQSVFTMGDIEITGNSISTIGTSGIYVYMDSWAWKVYDNAEVHFGNFLFNDNIVNSTGHGININAILYWGSDVHNNSLATFGNVEVNRNEIIAGSIPSGSNRGIYFLFYENGYEMYGNSQVYFSHIQLNDNNITCYDSHGIYINAYELAYTMTGTAIATFGDFSVSNNIIESQNQGIYYQFEYAGYNMHDMSTFEMGSIKVLNNTIISGRDPASVDSYGILFRSRYVGYEMYNETQAIVGPILVNDNTLTVLFGTSASGIYMDWISDYGAYMYDMASFTMNGNIEVCRNTINTTNGDDGIACEIWNFGSYLWGDNTASFGNILFNDNTIIDAYNTGLYISMITIGYITYGNSSVTIGNIELNNNDDIQILDGSYFSAIYFYLDDIGSRMYDGSIFNMGHFQVNDNIIYNSSGYGMEIEAYGLGSHMYNSSSAYFGNFEFLRNNITSRDEGIFLLGFQYFAVDMYNNTSAFFGDFLINNNIISTRDPGGDGIYIDAFRNLGYQMNDQSYAEFSDFEVCDNKVHAQPLAYGIYIWPENWASDMYDNATFVMGDWLINNNTVFSSEYEGIYFYSTSFGYNMYGNSSAYFGKNEIMYNTVNSTGGDGIETWWWYDFGSHMYDYSHFEAGDCYIMFNNITSTSSTHYGLETGPQDTGYYVRDEAEAYFGDYIISNNVIYSEGTEGIDLWYYEVAYWLDNSNLPESRAIVEIGMVMITDNIITMPNGKGICVYGWDVAYSVNDYSSVITGGIYINRNTINSYDHGIDIYMWELSEDAGNNAQVWLGSFVIDDNKITAINGNGIYIYSEFFAYSTNDNAFVHMDDFHFTNNDIVAGITGIEFICEWWIELYDNSEARAPGLWVTGNNVSAPVSAFNYTTLNTPTRIDPGATFSSGNVTISDNIFDGGLYGVMIDWQKFIPSWEGQPEFYFENNLMVDGAANSIGLFMNNIQNATIESLYLDSYEQGIYVSNSNIWYMFNSTISNIPSYDLNLSATSFIGAVNTTFDNASVYFEDYDSLLNVGWFMNVYVQSQVFLPVPEANLTVKDVDGTDVFNGTTNLNGRAFYIICWEYQENITGIIKNFNDYTADANKAGSFGSAVPNPTMNQTRWINITLIDLIPPTIFSDNSDTAGTTGDPFYFEINATDNMGIVSVRVNYRFGGMGSYKNLTMNGTGPYWLNEIMPSDYVGFIEYYFTAVDSGGFWVNTTPTTAPITDNDPPTYTWVSQPSAGTTGESVLVSILATDNIDLTYYKIDIDGVLYDLIKDGDYYNYTINIPSDSAAPITYSIILNDSANNPNIITPPMITVTDNDQPTYSWVSQPFSGTTGESVLVSILATDNIDITYYKIEIDGILYDLTKDGDYYNYTINIPLDITASITYRLIINDSDNNPNVIPDTVIVVTDNDAPTYNWVSKPTGGVVGSSVLVSLTAYDNIGIINYTIYIDGVPFDMVKDGDYYNYTIDIPSGIPVDIIYNVTFRDAAGQLVETGDTAIGVISVDVDAPDYSWILHPTTGTTGESVLISLLATDNIGITYYKIEIDGVLYDLIKNGDYYNYTITIPTDSLASITYNIVFNDSANNPNSTAPTVLTVTDNDAPTYTWVLHPSTGTAGDSVLISLRAFDNIGVAYYKIEIDGTLYDLAREGGYFNYTINLPPGSSASVTYNIIFKDDADNQITTGDTVITVTIPVDNIPPEFNWVLHPDTGTTGESVLVSLLATDNIGITYYKISIDGTLYDLVKDDDYYNYTINIPTDSLASITYFVVFNDSANNPNTAADTVITVTDNDPGTISNPASDTSGQKGKEFRFQIDASDNIGISEVKVWYWFGDDDSQKTSLTLQESNGTYSGSFIPDESGTLHYYFEVTDEAGNTFESGENTVDIASEPEEEEANILPWILLVILIVVIILFFLLTRKRKEPEEIVEAEPEEELEEGELEEGAEDLEEEEEFEEMEPSEEIEPEDKLGEEGIDEEEIEGEEFEEEPEESLEEETEFEEIEPEEELEAEPEEGLEKEE